MTTFVSWGSINKSIDNYRVNCTASWTYSWQPCWQCLIKRLYKGGEATQCWPTQCWPTQCWPSNLHTTSKYSYLTFVYICTSMYIWPMNQTCMAYTVASAPTGTGSVCMRRFIVPVGRVGNLIFRSSIFWSFDLYIFEKDRANRSRRSLKMIDKSDLILRSFNHKKTIGSIQKPWSISQPWI